MSRLIRSGLVVAAILAVASSAVAAPPEAHKVFTDAANDEGPLAPDFTPPYMDLVAGYITERDTEIDFIWQVAGIDVATHLLALYHWEFALGETLQTIADCSAEGNRCFSIRASFNEDGEGQGAIESNCAGTPVVECELLDADVTVSVDADSNTVTATVQREDIGAVDGEIMVERELFRGIAALHRLGVPWGGETSKPVRDTVRPVTTELGTGIPTSFVCSCFMDTAGLTGGAYTMGTNKA